MYIVIFMASLNGSVVFMENIGVNDYLNIDQNCGELSEQVGEAEDTATDQDVGTGVGQTLFGAYAKLTDTLTSITDILLPADKYLRACGLPNTVVNLMWASIPLTLGFDLMLFMRRG